MLAGLRPLIQEEAIVPKLSRKMKFLNPIRDCFHSWRKLTGIEKWQSG